MAITFSEARINPPLVNTNWPPGDVNYPEKYDELITLTEATAQEVEAARGEENTLLDNLTNYLSYTLENPVVSNGFKFTNMLDGTGVNWTYPGPGSGGSQDYLTVKQWQDNNPASASMDELPPNGFNGTTYTIPNSELIIADTDFAVFDYQPDTLDNNGSSFYYPAAFNKTYTLDWNAAPGYSLVDLDNPYGTIPVPNNGDRVRFIFTNCGASDGISAATTKINKESDKIVFGQAMDYAIYDLVYTNTTTGWLFKNVILEKE